MGNLVKFKKWVCRADIGEYKNGNPAIKLIDTESKHSGDKLVAIASTNIEGLARDEIAIKDYNENEGIYDALLKAEIIMPMHRYTQSGYVERIPVTRLRTKAVAETGMGWNGAYFMGG